MINHRQISWLVGVLLTTGGITTLNKDLIEIARVDAWFSEIGGTLFALVVCALFYYLSRMYPGKDLFEINYELAGKWGGHLLNLFCLQHFWLILIRDLSVFSDFMNTTLLIRTPSEIIVYLLIFVIIYYARSSVEVAARVNDILFPLFFGLLFSLPLALANVSAFDRMEPVLGSGISSIVKGNIMATGWYGDILVAGAFLHTVANARQLYAGLRNGVMVTMLGLTILLFMSINVLGVSVAGRTLYPSYTLVQQVQITDFLDRTELFMFSLWLPAFLIKGVFIVQASLRCLVSFTRTNKSTSTLFAGQYGWFAVITTIVGFDSITEVFNFGNYGAFLFVLTLHPPLYLLIYILARRQAKKKGLPKKDRDDERSPARDHIKKKTLPWILGWVNRGTPNGWKWLANGLLLGCVAAVGVGAIFGPDFYQVGWLAGLVYALLMVLAFIASMVELYQSNLVAKKKNLAREQEADTA
jgi:spore germination protein KB